jgi:tetrapyrrole methylase family protein / MazG family protein
MIALKSSDEKYTYEDFLQIIRDLRSENGCPWDKVQTHDSLRPCMMEEAAELLASIRIYDQTGSAENMREELGDVLLQVVMHAQIATEEKLFDMTDVVDEVSRKMIRRHPHIFGTVKADTPDQVLANWEEIKKEEKKGKDWIKSPLQEIPRELPSLTRATKVLKKIDKLYEPGKSYEENVKELQDCAAKLQDLSCEEGTEELQKVMGDMLLSLSDIARKSKLTAEQILADRIDDLIDDCESRKMP